MKIGILGSKLMVHFLTKGNQKAVSRLPKYEGKTLLDIESSPNCEDGQKFDIYFADKEKSNGKTLIDIHGGSYCFGTRKHNLAIALEFLGRGYNVVTLDYRQPFGKDFGQRIQLQDLASEIRVLWERADEFGLDRNAFYLTGDSAGGHFALTIAQASQNEEVSKKTGIDLGGAKFRAVLVNCPVFDYAHVTGKEVFSKKVQRRIFGQRCFEDGYLEEISPKTYANELTLPLFCSTCKKDFIREESLKLKKAFEDIKKEGFVFLDIDSSDSKIQHVHNVTHPEYEESKKVNGAMDDFMKRF